MPTECAVYFDMTRICESVQNNGLQCFVTKYFLEFVILGEKTKNNDNLSSFTKLDI